MKIKRVLLESEIAPTVLDVFQGAKMAVDTVTPKTEVLEALVQHGAYDALFIQSKTPVPLSVLETAGRGLRVIGVVGDELANINVADASMKGILIKVTEYTNAYQVANLTLRLMVMLLSRGFRHREAKGARLVMDANDWLAEDYSGFELAEMTVGLIGCGNVAQALATEIKPHCSRLLGYDNHPKRVFEHFHRRAPLELPSIEYCQLRELLECSDVISIHTAGEDPVFKGAALYQAKQRPFIVNTARSGNLDEAALFAALQEKRVRGLAFTLPAEQIKKREFEEWVKPFLDLKNVLIAPAAGRSTVETERKSARKLAQSVVDYLVSGDLSLAVNPMDVIPARRETLYPIRRGARRSSAPLFLGK
jgi:D-3-phosphoglycerate dehydrogenase / 2-oxoglutarate reductase